MKARLRYLITGMLAAIVGIFLLGQRPLLSAVSYTGLAQATTSAIQLDLSLNPPIAKPGDTQQLTLRLFNRTPQIQTPTIEVKLPGQLAAAPYNLPAGATLNLQNNRIDWIPWVPGNGTIEMLLDLKVQAVDLIAPEQSVTVNLIHQGQEATATATIWLGIPPLIQLSETSARIAVGQPIELKAGINGPEPIQVTWDLGDGRRLELVQPVVVFPATGHYDIVVEAANPAGRVKRTMRLTVLPQPVAGFQISDDQPAIGQPVTFTNISGGQPPMIVSWDFGDGNTISGEQEPTHIYQQGGRYLARLVIENEYGRSEAVWPVTVGEPPTTDLLLPEQATVGLPIEGQALGDETIIRYLWDMGDGYTREGNAISHIYRRPGDYYVTLIADNGFGQSQAGRWVQVAPGISQIYFPMSAGMDSIAAVATTDLTDGAQLDPVEVSLSDIFTLQPIQFPANTSPAEQLLAYINAVRSQFELAPLSYNAALSTAAQTHAQDKSGYPDFPHTGRDGSTAAERILRAGYRGGYAGEATAWGFIDPRLAVEFWMNSESHRPLLLNRLANELGVGYVEDYATSNVWHWAAEFAVSYGAPLQPVIRLQSPSSSQLVINSDMTNYSWLWPLPLGPGERFTVYLMANNKLTAVGTTTTPVYGSRYLISADALRVVGPSTTQAAANAAYQWLVRLEDGLGGVIAESAALPITIAVDPSLLVPPPLPTIPLMTATPAGSIPIPVEPSATPLPPQPTDEPPPVDLPPVLITATPIPIEP